MSTTSTNYLVRQRGLYHYRRRIPKKWRGVLGRSVWKITLGTSNKRTAFEKARLLAVEHDQLLRDLTWETSNLDESKELAVQAGRQLETEFFATPKTLDETGELEAKRRAINRRLRAVQEVAGASPDRLEDQRLYVDAAKHMESQAELAEAKEAYDNLGAPPMDPEALEDWDVEKFKLERRISRLSPQQHRISQLAPEWRQFVKHSDETWRKRQGNLNRFIEVNGDMSVTQITPQHIIKFRDALVSDGVAANTIAAKLSTIKALLNYAKRDRRLIAINPAEDIRPPQDDRASDQRGRMPFLPAELRLILDTARKVWNKTDRHSDLLMLLRVLIYTGARPSEIIQLRPQDVRDKVIHISDEGGRNIKNESSIRPVPVHRAIADFADYGQTNEAYVFQSFADSRRKAQAVADAFVKLIRKTLGIIDRRKTLYSIRHSFADACRNAAMQDSVRYRLMGHVEDNRVAGAYGGGYSVEILRMAINRVDPLTEST